jgi:hypothetical protein
MRTTLQTLAILVIVLALVPMAQAGTAAAQPELANTGDELVIITRDGRLEARDPYTPPGLRPVVWQSPETGFTDVATGDFNGDGSDEVVGLRGGEAVVYDPVLLPGEPNTARTFLATAGQFWRNAATGDLDGDGADELILAESSGSGTQMFAFKFNASTGWNQTFSGFFGAPWVGLATGDMIGNSGRDQVVGIRNVGSTCQIIIFNPANNWQTLNEYTRGFPWTSVAVGDVTLDGAGKQEIVVTRSDVGAALPSMFVFRWEAQFPELQEQEREVFNPEFRWIALADVNASSDKEVFLLRNNPGAGQAALASRNYGVDQGTPVFNELIGQTKWNGIQAGDVDADGRDEVIVMSPDEYLIYNQPDVNTAFTSFPGSYSTTGNFAVGNLDGAGQPSGPTLSVTPLSVTLNLQAGQNASQPITITNSGTGALSWTATVVDGAAWLSMSPSSGAAPATPQLLVSTGGVAPGSYVGRVRIDGSAGAVNSPQTITVNLTVTAPQFAVQPNRVSWLYQPPVNPGVRTVSVSGQNVPWHAGVVPMSAVTQIEQAIASGQPVKLQDGLLVIGEGAEGVPIVDYIDVNPVAGIATPGGVFVDLSLVLDRVDYGFSAAAVVFVADTVASPPAVVVRASVLRTQPNGADLLFMPLIVQGP